MNQERRKALVGLATDQVGIQESGGNNSGPMVELYQSVIGRAEKEPWCVSFIQWCVREIDKKFEAKTILFPTESSQILWLKTPASARIKLPEIGSIVIWTKFKDDTPLSIGHAGIVREILDNEWILTIEGNTSPSDGIQREGDGVFMKRRRIHQPTGPMRIAGFLMPWSV